MSFGANYGYRIKLMEEMKLELSSSIGTHSNFQVSIMTPKYKVAIPIFAKAESLDFEMRKWAVFVAVYLLFEGYNLYRYRSTRNRRR